MPASEIIIRAQIGSPGLVRGTIIYYTENNPNELSEVAESAEAEERRWRKAEQAATRELEKQKEALQKAGSAEAAAAVSVIHSHILALRDPTVRDEIRNKIYRERLPAAKAVFEVFEQLIQSFRKLPDLLFQEKARDIEDIRRRLLSWVMHRRQRGNLTYSEIIYTESLLPGQVLRLARSGVRGMVVRNSTATSHELILARALGLPFLYHPEREPEIPAGGVPALLDANTGRLVLHPAERQQTLTKKLRRSSLVRQAAVADFKLYLNLSLPEELPLASKSSIAGVGLFRSELPFLADGTQPSYRRQVKVYTQMMRPFRGKTFAFRLFDLGGDKQLHGQNDRREVRSIRRLLQDPDLLLTQLKAVLAAQSEAQTRLTIVVPFVTLTEELLAIKKILRELQKSPLPVAAMVENPAAVAMIPFWNKIVSGYNIGSNDLLQFLTATQRTDEHQNQYSDPLQEANLEALENILHRATKPVTLCGELPTQKGWLELLLAMGYRNFSVSAGRVEEMQERAAAANLENGREILAKIRRIGELKKRRALFRKI